MRKHKTLRKRDPVAGGDIFRTVASRPAFSPKLFTAARRGTALHTSRKT